MKNKKMKFFSKKNQSISSVLMEMSDGELVYLYQDLKLSYDDCFHLVPKLLNNHASAAICKSLSNCEMRLFFSKHDPLCDVLSKMFLFESYLRNINKEVLIEGKIIDGGYQIDFHAENNPLLSFLSKQSLILGTIACTPNNPYFFSNPKYCDSEHLACSHSFQLGLEDGCLFFHENLKDLYFNQILAFQLGNFALKDNNIQSMMIKLNKHRYKQSKDESFFNRFIEWEDSLENELVG